MKITQENKTPTTIIYIDMSSHFIYLLTELDIIFTLKLRKMFIITIGALQQQWSSDQLKN